MYCCRRWQSAGKPSRLPLLCRLRHVSTSLPPGTCMGNILILRQQSAPPVESISSYVSSIPSIWEVLSSIWEVFLSIWEVFLSIWEVLPSIWEVLPSIWEVLLSIWKYLHFYSVLSSHKCRFRDDVRKFR